MAWDAPLAEGKFSSPFVTFALLHFENYFSFIVALTSFYSFPPLFVITLACRLSSLRSL